MRILLRQTSLSVSRSPGSWLTLMLLFVVLVPTLGLLWITNRAIDNERLATRQKLIDAYRAQLVGIQERVEAAWQRQADELAHEATRTPADALLARIVRAGTADAVICYNAAGAAIYPGVLHVQDAPDSSLLGIPPTYDPAGVTGFWRAPAPWVAAQKLESEDPVAAARAYEQLAAEAADVNLIARALQAQARALMRAGDRPAAIALLTGALHEPRLRRAHDSEGRLLAPSASLLAIELLQEAKPDDARAVRERLQAFVLAYSHASMPAVQRRFLLRELIRLNPDPAMSAMLAAEDLVAAYVESREHPPREPALRAAALDGVWQFASADGRVLLLHRTENLSQRLQALIAPTGLSEDVRLDFIEPGHDAESALLSGSAGPALPGWRLALTIKDPLLFETATSKRASSYVWIVVLLVLTVVVLALLALGLMRRQTALTQLRNDLVANVTHELKTPLASMRLLVETLLNTPQLHEQTTREYLQLIATENLRLSRLIGNFLTFSRIERNKYTFDFKPVAVHAIVHSAVAAVKDRFEAPGCTFDVAVAPDLPPVMADADAVVTALVNLLDNAWKYSGETKQIVLTAAAANGSVAFAVRDDGIGLAPRDVKRVFQRFYQVRQSQSTGGGGSGLGLSIVQFIVSAHGGTVRVESESGRGSTFTITLPAATPSQ